MRKEPRRQRIIVFTNVGHELLRKLATRVKLSEIPHNGSPNEVIIVTTATSIVSFGRVEVDVKVNVECVFYRSNSLRNIAGEFVELLVND